MKHSFCCITCATSAPPLLSLPYTHYVLRNQILLSCLVGHFLHGFAVSTAVQQFTTRSSRCKFMLHSTRHETGILKLRYDKLIIVKHFVVEDDTASVITDHVRRMVSDLKHCTYVWPHSQQRFHFSIADPVHHF